MESLTPNIFLAELNFAILLLLVGLIPIAGYFFYAKVIKQGYGKIMAYLCGGFLLLAASSVTLLRVVQPVAVSAPTSSILSPYSATSAMESLTPNPLATEADIAMGPLLLIVLIGIVVLFFLAALIKHGYGKSLAIVFGGLLLLVGIVMFTLVGSRQSVTQSESASVTATSGRVPTKNEFKDLTELVTNSETIELNAKEESKEATKDVSDDLIAIATKQKSEIEIGSESASLKDAPEWINGVEKMAHKVFESEPYLGSVFTSNGEPTRAVKENLTSQLSRWLIDEYQLSSYHVSKEADGIICVTGTNPKGLWDQFVTKTHVIKNETSVGDTETLYILAEKNSKNLDWLISRNQAERIAAEQSKAVRLVSGIGGGIFLGLISLYGILSLDGSKKKNEASPT